MAKQFRDFEEAREFVRSLNLKGQKEWHEYCKSGKKPDDIPQKPERTYKNEWKGSFLFSTPTLYKVCAISSSRTC